MNAEPQQNGSALQRLLLKTGTTASDQNRVSRVLMDLERLAAKGLAEKLDEYAHVGASIENLTAELRMGLAISSVTGLPIEFQSGDAADLRLRAGGLDCTIEVEHKSSASAFAAVFYATPE